MTVRDFGLVGEGVHKAKARQRQRGNEGGDGGEDGGGGQVVSGS